MSTSCNDYLLFLCVNPNEDHALALWFCETGADVDVLPCNACAFKGTDFEQFKYCAEYFSRFPAVFLAISDKEKRNALSDSLSFYLPTLRVILPAHDAFKAGKTVAEIVAASDDPAAAVNRIGFGAREAPCRGLLDIGAVKRPKQNGRPLLSGFAELDRAIGGFRDGELTVLTGQSRNCDWKNFKSCALLHPFRRGRKKTAWLCVGFCRKKKQSLSQQERSCRDITAGTIPVYAQLARISTVTRKGLSIAAGSHRLYLAM